MLPFLFGMLAPTLLAGTGIAPWLAGGLGALAGDVIDDGEIDPMNILMGGLGGGLMGGGGIGPLFGGGAPLANPGVLAANPDMVGSATGAAAGKAGLGALMNNPGMLMGGAALLSGLGGLEGGEPEERQRRWVAQAPAPDGSTPAPVPSGYTPGVSPERNYGIQPSRIDERRDRYLAGGATYMPRYAEGGEVANRSYLSSRPAFMPFDTNRIGGASANARTIQAGYNLGYGPRGLRTAGLRSLPVPGSRQYVPTGTPGTRPTAPSAAPAAPVETVNPREPYWWRSQWPGGLAPFAEGGKVDTSMPEVQDAIAAIMGDPNVDPQQAMGRLYAKLVAQYGEEQADQMIRELVAMVEGDRRVPEAGGADGMADDQMAMVDGAEPARLSSGEVVASVPTLAAMGSGDADKGADKLMSFMEDVRKEHYGRKQHPDRVDFEGMAARMA